MCKMEVHHDGDENRWGIGGFIYIRGRILAMANLKAGNDYRTSRKFVKNVHEVNMYNYTANIAIATLIFPKLHTLLAPQCDKLVQNAL